MAEDIGAQMFFFLSFSKTTFLPISPSKDVQLDSCAL